MSPAPERLVPGTLATTARAYAHGGAAGGGHGGIAQGAMLVETIVTRRRARAVEPESFADTHAAGAVTRYSNLNKKDSDSD